MLDVAGGKGALAFELVNLNGVPATVLDPRPLALRRHALLLQARVRLRPCPRSPVAALMRGVSAARRRGGTRTLRDAERRARPAAPAASPHDAFRPCVAAARGTARRVGAAP